MQSHRVIPTLDVAKAGHLRLGLRCEPATAEQLGLEGGEEALGHGVVVGVTDRPHRWSNTCLATPLAKCHRRILGGFKRSQHHDEGGCDDHSKAPIGSIWEGAIAVPRSTASGRTR